MNSTNNQVDNNMLVKSIEDCLLEITLNFMVDNFQTWSWKDIKLRKKVSDQIKDKRMKGQLQNIRYNVLLGVFDPPSFINFIRGKINTLSGSPRQVKITIITEIFDVFVKHHSNWYKISDQNFKESVSGKLVVLREKYGILEDCKYDILLTEDDKILLHKIKEGQLLCLHLIPMIDKQKLSKYPSKEIFAFFRMANDLMKKK